MCPRRCTQHQLSICGPGKYVSHVSHRATVNALNEKFCMEWTQGHAYVQDSPLFDLATSCGWAMDRARAAPGLHYLCFGEGLNKLLLLSLMKGKYDMNLIEQKAREICK